MEAIDFANKSQGLHSIYMFIVIVSKSKDLRGNPFLFLFFCIDCHAFGILMIPNARNDKKKTHPLNPPPQRRGNLEIDTCKGGEQEWQLCKGGGTDLFADIDKGGGNTKNGKIRKGSVKCVN